MLDFAKAYLVDNNREKLRGAEERPRGVSFLLRPAACRLEPVTRVRTALAQEAQRQGRPEADHVGGARGPRERRGLPVHVHQQGGHERHRARRAHSAAFLVGVAVTHDQFDKLHAKTGL
jgi:hypothetical protein